MNATMSRLLLRSAAVLFLAILPTVLARKCHVCSSQFQPGCVDSNQISQLYQDCALQGPYGQQGGQYPQQGGQYPQQGGQYPQQGGQFGGQFPQQGSQFGGQYPQQQGGQFGGMNPQQPGQQQFSQQYGAADRCFKTVVINNQGPAIVTRGCGTPNTNVNLQAMDSCTWYGNVQTCVCNSNYCNGSKRLTPSSSAALAALLVGLLTLFAHLQI